MFSSNLSIRSNRLLINSKGFSIISYLKLGVKIKRKQI
jgi:hypothetical protein